MVCSSILLCFGTMIGRIIHPNPSLYKFIPSGFWIFSKYLTQLSLFDCWGSWKPTESIKKNFYPYLGRLNFCQDGLAVTCFADFLLRKCCCIDSANILSLKDLQLEIQCANLLSSVDFPDPIFPRTNMFLYWTFDSGTSSNLNGLDRR